jgi:hypothetical protein
MIDHASVAVRDLINGDRFYATVLAPLGLSKLRDWPGTIGFGKKYPEFWINKREAMQRVAPDSGVHICLRAPDTAAVDAFHAAALSAWRQLRRRARLAVALSRDVLRRIRARSGWQPHRSRDICAAGRSVVPWTFKPLVPAKARTQLPDSRFRGNERRRTNLTAARAAPPLSFPPRWFRARRSAAWAEYRRRDRPPADRRRARVAAPAQRCACAPAATAADPRSR